MTHGVSHIRTGSHNQSAVEAQFGLAVHPAPDFVVFDSAGSLRAILECKGAKRRVSPVEWWVLEEGVS